MINLIFKQSEPFNIDSKEYVINELQYEYRRFSALAKDKKNEKHLMKKWVQIMIERYGEDAGLDFFKTVT